MVSGLPDWQRGISVNSPALDINFPAAFVTRPQASAHVRNGAATNTSSYTTIATYTPSNNHRVYLSKASAVCINAHQFQVLLGTDVVGEALISDYGWYVDFWPFGVYLDGNGSDAITLKAKAKTTGETLYGVIFFEDILKVSV